MQCLDEDAILSFCAGRLPPDERARAEGHIATCDECRQLVSAFARASLPEIGMDPTTPLAVGMSSSRGKATSPVAPGDVLAGKYEVERVLGHGGMGVVVAARHTQLEQRVALKFLLPAACEVPGAVSRFLREGKAAARITSEHVARVIDTGMLETGAPYLVMEYLEGEDLGRHLETRRTLSEADAIDYVLQACEAVVEAHALGVVHRDLKPANLFLTQRKDGSALVKVLDFGISKLDGGSRSDLTSASAIMGSPRYMSPEQMLSARDVDARTDIWALGVILFELVTGRAPWEADTVQGLCALITSAPAPMLRSLAPFASPVLESAIARCLAKDRGERLQTVADLAMALEPIAPPGARLSVDRIVRVGGHRLTPPVPPAGLRSPSAPPSALAASAVSAPRSSSLVRVLAVGVAFLLALGLVLAFVVPRKGGAPAAAGTADPAPITPAVSESAPSAAESAPVASPASPDPLPPPSSRSAQAARPGVVPVKPPLLKASSAPPPVVIAPPSPPAPDPGKALSERK